MDSVEEHSAETPAAVPDTTVPQSQTLQTRSFKLRFAAQHELGRSNISAIRPLSLPVPLADKFYARVHETGDEAATERALQTVRERFARGPRELYAHPVTSAHEYGWWSERGALAERGTRGARHHIRDSAWMRARLRLLAQDAAYKRQ